MRPLSKVPDFLSIGHVTLDRVEGGVQWGGAALYSAVTALRLGKQAALLTSYGPDFLGGRALEGLATSCVPAEETTTFQNRYRGDRRIQSVTGEAAFLEAAHVPAPWWKAPVVHLCPVLHEVSLEMGAGFSGSLLGVSPQGWLRRWDRTGRIRPRRWEGFEGLLRRAHVLIVSPEDVEGHEDLVEAFRRFVPIVAVTHGRKGAWLYTRTGTIRLGAYRARERDPTGAGDGFAAAFLVRYAETGDVEEAGRFASCVGSFVVERPGIAGIPSRSEVEGRMRDQALTVVTCSSEG